MVVLLLLQTTLAILLTSPSAIIVSDSYSFVPRISTNHIPCLHPSSFSITTARRKNGTHRTTSSSCLMMKISKGRSKKDSKGSSLQEINRLRTRFAGRPGTKNFIDPNKVFIGNLPFDATDEHVSEFLQAHLGSLQSVESVKIIRDWKTNKSKGYGFIQFTDPMYATAAMEIMKQKNLMGRIINLRQGRKKDENDMDLMKRKIFIKVRSRGKYNLDDEGHVIESALDLVDEMDHDDFHSSQPKKQENRVLMIDNNNDALPVETTTINEEVFDVNDFDDLDDSVLCDGTDDESDIVGEETDSDSDDDDVEDGIFEEIYGKSKWEDPNEDQMKNMNRQQRREAAKRRPRKKLPFKGFG